VTWWLCQYQGGEGDPALYGGGLEEKPLVPLRSCCKTAPISLSCFFCPLSGGIALCQTACHTQSRRAMRLHHAVTVVPDRALVLWWGRPVQKHVRCSDACTNLLSLVYVSFIASQTINPRDFSNYDESAAWPYLLVGSFWRVSTDSSVKQPVITSQITQSTSFTRHLCLHIQSFSHIAHVGCWLLSSVRHWHAHLAHRLLLHVDKKQQHACASPPGLPTKSPSLPGPSALAHTVLKVWPVGRRWCHHGLHSTLTPHLDLLQDDFVEHCRQKAEGSSAA